MVNLIDTIVYAGRLKDKSALMSSSSGGAFTALSNAFLKAEMLWWLQSIIMRIILWNSR